MRRGFKAFAERTAEAARHALSLEPAASLCPWKYAAHLRVNVLQFESVGLSDHDVRQLTLVDDDSWSAMTLQEGQCLVIILNPSHALTRQRNDLMHELAHIQLDHKPARVDVSKMGLLLLSDYSEEQEQEADWLAGALLLPRDGLWQLRSQGRSINEISNFYGVSDALTEWRVRMTGINTQLRRAGRT